MTKEKIEEYKNKLEHERILVSKEIKDLEKPLDFGDDVDHFEEDTDKTEEMDSQLAAAKSIKDRLGEINIALGKIQEGKYGICEKCGMEIEEEILDIDPESRFCKSCKA